MILQGGMILLQCSIIVVVQHGTIQYCTKGGLGLGEVLCERVSELRLGTVPLIRVRHQGG